MFSMNNNSSDRNKECFHLLSVMHILSHSNIKEVPPVTSWKTKVGYQIICCTNQNIFKNERECC